MKQTIYTSHVLLTAYSSEYLDTHAGSSASARVRVREKKLVGYANLIRLIFEL